MTTKIESNNWKVSWQLLSLVLALSFGAVGFAATRALLRLPTNSSCNSISLWFTSATNRIYCAQLKAEKNTVEDLLAAIALLEELSDDHPLNHEVNRYVNEWSSDILALAQKNLDSGDLDVAIATANQIPKNAENTKIIDNKINKWRQIWEKGKAVEEEVEFELKESQWNKAFLVAVKLLNINNTYWRNTRYQEIVNNINLAREESKKLDGAYVSVKNGGVNNYLKTLEIAGQIPATSYSYNEAQKLITKAEEELFKIANKLLDKSQWYELAELANQIPTESSLNSQALDWNTLARAGKNIDLSTVSGIELAIAEAGQIPSDSKIYLQAQDLIKDWSVQKEDLAYLASARTLARSGAVGDLNAAISKARLIEEGNTLYREAQREIKSWRREIEVIEDRPLIIQAQEFARNNTTQGWQSAINQASQISSNRALYGEARDLIRKWQRNIETAEDRPIIQRAIALGNSNRYQEAISIANRIGRGRALYSEAQTNVRKWRTEINAKQNLDLAYGIAKSNDEQSLLRAINMARRIPLTSSVGFQSRQAIDLWSEQMLNIAQRLGDTYSIPALEKAIRIAGTIPRGNSAYNRAQIKIKEWERKLYPSSSDNSSLEETNFAN